MLKDEENEIGEYFASNFLQLQRAISPQKMKKFRSLDRNSERINFLLGYPEAHVLSFETNDNIMKNSEKALQFKDIGNKYFGRGEFLKALETYSNAVLLAPKKDLGVILANRSATLYHLAKYNYALTDIEEALRAGYPQELFYKIEERRARCLLGLKRHDEAIIAFRDTLKALDNTKLHLEKKQKLEADIRVMLAVMQKGNQMAQKAPKIPQKKDKDNGLKKTTIKIEDANPLYPSCSKAVEIKDAGGDIGRHAVATRNIEPGEILAVEKPHCSFILAEHRLTHCHLCMSKIFVPIPSICQICSYLAYCSTSCRDMDVKVHENECAMLPSLWMSKTSVTCFLAIRAITQQSFQELMKLKDQLKSSKGRFEASAKQPYRSDSVEAYYGLSN